MLGIRRREFIAGLGGAAAWPLAAKAQQPQRMRRIGVLLPAAADDAEFQDRVGAFLQCGSKHLLTLLQTCRLGACDDRGNCQARTS
jgi:hypothetical protein